MHEQRPLEEMQSATKAIETAVAQSRATGQAEPLAGLLLEANRVAQSVKEIGLARTLRAYGQAYSILCKKHPAYALRVNRIRYGRPFLSHVAKAYELNVGRFGALKHVAEAFWEVHGSLSPAEHLEMWTKPPPNFTASSMLPEDPGSRASLLAIQHCGEMGDELLGLEVAKLAQKAYPDCAKIPHFAAGNALRQASRADSPSQMERFARKAIELEAIARALSPDDSYASLFLSTQGNAHVYLGISLRRQGFPKESEHEIRCGVRLLKRRLEVHRSALALDFISNAYGELGDLERSRRLAVEATTLEPVLPASQLTVLEGAQTEDVFKPDYTGIIGAYRRVWFAMHVDQSCWPVMPQDRLSQVRQRLSARLVQKGNLPAALAIDAETALRRAPEAREVCEAAYVGKLPIDVRFAAGRFQAVLDMWNFGDSVVVGDSRFDLFGKGEDKSEAEEDFRRLVEGIKCQLERGRHASARSEYFTEVLGWINQHVFPERADDSSAGTHLSELSRAYYADDQGPCARAIRALDQQRAFMTGSQRSEFLRIRAWVGSRLGECAPERHLEYLLQDGPVSTMTCSDFLCVACFSGLRPAVWAEDWYRKATEELKVQDSDPAAPLIYEYYGAALLAYGDSRHALDLFQRALNAEVSRIRSPRVVTRILSRYGEALRCTGEYELARDTLSQVATYQRESRMFRKLANDTLLNQAKVSSSEAEMLGYLKQARKLGKRFSPKARVKAMLLEARVCSDAKRIEWLKGRVFRAMQRIPDLEKCPLATQIRNNWARWVSPTSFSPELDYWGL